MKYKTILSPNGYYHFWHGRFHPVKTPVLLQNTITEADIIDLIDDEFYEERGASLPWRLVDAKLKII